MPVVLDLEANEPAALNKLIDINNQRIIEIGCGDGHFIWSYANKAAHVTGIDIKSEGIASAHAKTPNHLKGKVRFIESSIENFKLPEGETRFDIAILGWSL